MSPSKATSDDIENDLLMIFFDIFDSCWDGFEHSHLFHKYVDAVWSHVEMPNHNVFIIWRRYLDEDVALQ